MLKFGRGDTIIEVTFAVVIFSTLAIAGLSIMNRTVNSVQRSLEITLVRQDIKTQAEALRFVHGAYLASGGSYDSGSPAAVWNTLVSGATYTLSTVPAFDSILSSSGSCTSPVEASGGGRAFIINPRTLKIVSLNDGTFSQAQTYSQIRYGDDDEIATAGVEGVWIQQVRGGGTASSSTPRYRDFHIRACWEAPGGEVPVTLGTIVRLYEPS